MLYDLINILHLGDQLHLEALNSSQSFSKRHSTSAQPNGLEGDAMSYVLHILTIFSEI